MNIPKTHPSRPSLLAMETLEPIMNDSNYFLHPGDSELVNLALLEIEKKLIPISSERLQQILSRLCLHFNCGSESRQAIIISEYKAALQHYPEDLMCAAYHNILMHYIPKSMPRLSHFFTFMDPEMNRRKTLQRKLVAISSHKEAIA